MDKIAVIGDNDSILGFRLAGVVNAFPAQNAEESEKAVQSALAAGDIGILIITQEALESLSLKTKKHITSLAKPAVIEVPGKRESAQSSESIAALIKKVMGVELK